MLSLSDTGIEEILEDVRLECARLLIIFLRSFYNIDNCKYLLYEALLSFADLGLLNQFM